MTWTCLCDFVGVTGGKEQRYAAGDIVTAAAAKEMGLADKPDLATQKGSAPVDAKTAKP